MSFCIPFVVHDGAWFGSANVKWTTNYESSSRTDDFLCVCDVEMWAKHLNGISSLDFRRMKFNQINIHCLQSWAMAQVIHIETNKNCFCENIPGIFLAKL